MISQGRRNLNSLHSKSSRVMYGIKLVPRRDQEWDCVVTCLVVKKIVENSSKDVCVLVCLKTHNGVSNRPLNFSRQKEALAPAIRSH